MNVLLFAAGLVAAAPVQARVDQLVDRCGAKHVVRLVAQGREDVVIEMQIVERPPSPGENQKFECVLRGMERMKDPKFGFTGNATSDR